MTKHVCPHNRVLEAKAPWEVRQSGSQQKPASGPILTVPGRSRCSMAHVGSPGVRRDLTEVTHAALRSTGGDGRGIAMQGIHLGRFIIGS